MASESTTIKSDYKPLGNICEYLTAFHAYAAEAREGKTRVVEATHFCSHVRKGLRQCLIYDSNAKDARLIGVEYMIPKERYLMLDPEEQKLWHSHEYEVQSGMLICPQPASWTQGAAAWEAAELGAMREVIGLYGKTWHFWQVDAEIAAGNNNNNTHQDLPLGYPVLMGSLTCPQQLDLNTALARRDAEFGIRHAEKARTREGLVGPGIPENADSWWKAT